MGEGSTALERCNMFWRQIAKGDDVFVMMVAYQRCRPWPRAPPSPPCRLSAQLSLCFFVVGKFVSTNP